RISFTCHHNLICTRLHQQPLMPDPVPIKFIDVADERIRCRAIEQDRCAGMAFELNISERARDFFSRRLERHIEAGRFTSANMDGLCFRYVAVVVDTDAVCTGWQIDGLAAVADGLAINEDVR